MWDTRVFPRLQIPQSYRPPPTVDPPEQYAVGARSLADNFIIEFIASLFVFVSLALFWNVSDELRVVPAATLGLVMLCLKDEDLFFPDASPTVSMLLYALGGYHWSHLIARVGGQTCALGLAVWFCMEAALPPLAFRVDQPYAMVFYLEALGSTLEHLTVIYFVLPLLPIAQQSQRVRLFFQVRPKCSAPSGPSPREVAYAAGIISVLHYVLQRGFCAEVNPYASIVIAAAMQRQGKNTWKHVGVAVLGQMAGVVFTAFYTLAFAPRVPRSSAAR